jgi:hypothetical protein
VINSVVATRARGILTIVSLGGMVTALLGGCGAPDPLDETEQTAQAVAGEASVKINPNGFKGSICLPASKCATAGATSAAWVLPPGTYALTASSTLNAMPPDTGDQSLGSITIANGVVTLTNPASYPQGSFLPLTIEGSTTVITAKTAPVTLQRNGYAGSITFSGIGAFDTGGNLTLLRGRRYRMYDPNSVDPTRSDIFFPQAKTLAGAFVAGVAIGAIVGAIFDAAYDALTTQPLQVTEADVPPNLVDPDRAKHILDGDGATSGGHRSGTGKPGKSEFPADWSDEKILGEISDVATHPGSTTAPGRGGRSVVTGTRDGIDIEVIVGKGKIITGYPTNVERNPK